MLDMGLIRELVDVQDLNAAIRVFDAGMSDAVAVAPAYTDNARQEILQGSFGIACEEIEQGIARQALSQRVQAALAQPANQPPTNQPQDNQQQDNQQQGNQQQGNQQQGNQQQGNQQQGNQQQGNQQQGNQQQGNQPATRRGLPWWLWLSLGIALVAILIGGTARVLQRSGWGPQTQQAPDIPALDPTPTAAPADKPAAPAANGQRIATISFSGNTWGIEGMTMLTPSNCSQLFTKEGTEIEVKGDLWCFVDDSLEKRVENNWVRVAQLGDSKRFKLESGYYRVTNDQGGPTHLALLEVNDRQ